MDKLKTIVSPPEHPVNASGREAWNQIEEALGVTLPDDYKSYITTYGDGYLANFIHVFNPFSDSPALSLLTWVKDVCQDYRFLKETEGNKQVPYAVHPDKPGLLPWGRNDNGNYIFWLTEGEPDNWPVILAEGRSARYERFNLGMVTFLGKALSHGLKSRIWPDDFPDPDVLITFQPAKIKNRRKPKN